MVASPSAQPPTQPAVSTLTAAPISGGGLGGRVQIRARSTVTRPVVADLLAGEQGPDDVHALAAAGRCGAPCAATAWPVMCSLDASPVPSATQKRPSYIAARVAMAWAMIAGW